MGTFDELTDWLNRYGGRNGTANASNWGASSYGTQGALGSGYSDYSYSGNSIEGRAWQPSYNGSNATAYDVTGDTGSSIPGGRYLGNGQYQTPRYGNRVYTADYNAGQGAYTGNTEKNTPLTRHNVKLEGGIGRHQTYHTYDPNYGGQYKKAKEAVEKERQKIEGSSKGYQFVGYDLESILETNGISSNRLKNKLLNATRININRTPAFTEVVNFGKQYIFFSKPDLNIYVDNAGTINPSIKENCPDLYMKIVGNPLVARSLQSSFDSNNTTSRGIITMLSNMCNACDWPSMGLSTKTGPKNIKGQGMDYGGDFFEAAAQHELDIQFIDYRDREIQTLFEIWTEYIEGVNNGTIMKKSLYISNNTIDYAINIWVMTLDESFNILSWGMATGCYPLSVTTDLLSYSAMPKNASELSGPFAFKWYVSLFSKPNTHRCLELLNYTTGFGELLATKMDGKENAYKYIHKQIGGYWIHAGYIPYHTTLYKGYEYHFNIEDKMAEMVGVHFNINSSGKLMYTLVFASKDVGPARKPGGFGTNEHEFYRYDDDIAENVRNWQTWAAQHPDYYKNNPNKDIIGTPLWNSEQFNPDYNAWLISQNGRSWNSRFNRGYSSANNRYGSFNNTGSNSSFFSGVVGQVFRAFNRT